MSLCTSGLISASEELGIGPEQYVVDKDSEFSPRTSETWLESENRIYHRSLPTD